MRYPEPTPCMLELAFYPGVEIDSAVAKSFANIDAKNFAVVMVNARINTGA